MGCRRGARAPGNAERRSPRAPGRKAACRRLDFSWRNPCWTSDFRKRKIIHLQARLFIYLFMPLNSWRFVMAGTGCADRWAAGWRDGWIRKGGGGGPRVSRWSLSTSSRGSMCLDILIIKYRGGAWARQVESPPQLLASVLIIDVITTLAGPRFTHQTEMRCRGRDQGTGRWQGDGAPQTLPLRPL